jgi:hypothetical protein
MVGVQIITLLDLTTLYFYFWGRVKKTIYSIRIHDIQHLQQPIREAVACHCGCSGSSVAGNEVKTA